MVDNYNGVPWVESHWEYLPEVEVVEGSGRLQVQRGVQVESLRVQLK